MNTETLVRVLKRLDAIGRAFGYVAMAMILLMIGCMIWEVVARKGFSTPTLWATTTSYMFNGTIFLIGAAFTLQANQHVRIDFLSTRLPVRVQHALNALFYLAIFLPALYLTTDFAAGKALKAYERGTLEAMSAWEPLIWPFLTGITLGIASFTLQVAIETIRHCVGLFRPDLVSPPSEREILEG